MEILNSLSYMDVIAYLLRLVGSCQIHRFIRDGKLCMHAHHTGNHICIICKGMADPSGIFHHRLSCLVHAVTV